MHTYKIVHNKKKIGMQISLLEKADNLAIITFNDLTKVKRYEKEKLSMRYQEIYLRNMAHDVRTPLNAVRATNENLKMEITDPECLKMIELSDSSCYMLVSMFDQIRELHRIRYDNFSLNSAAFDCRAMILKLFNQMRVQAEFKSLNMYLKIDPTLPKMIVTDSERLERILFVLLQNALKYTERGGSHLNVESAKVIDKSISRSNRQQPIEI